MAFDFIKKLFDTVDNVQPSHTEQIDVPESVLNRFILNSVEFRYYDPSTNELIFVFANKNVQMNKEKPQVSGPVLVSLMWIRQLACQNIRLYHSILDKYKSNITVSEEEMREFLWAYFRTGNTARGTQLIQFYERGKSLISFLDAMSKHCNIILSSEDSHCSFQNTNAIYSCDNISDDKIASIIAR